MRGGDGDRRRRSPYLPDDYYLDETSERDFVVLCAGDGTEVAWFSAVGADPREIERVAWKHFRERQTDS
jgi:fructose 1,6-bisphosphatase